MKTIAVVCLFVIGCSLVAGQRSRRPVGGWIDEDINSPRVVEFTKFITEHHNKVSNSLYYKKPIQVISAQKQVVNGIKYELKVLIGQTHCVKRQSPSALEFCQVDDNGEKEECVYRVWAEPGEVKPVVLSRACTMV